MLRYSPLTQYLTSEGVSEISTVLVTGGTGLIGSEAVRQPLSQGHEVVYTSMRRTPPTSQTSSTTSSGQVSEAVRLGARPYFEDHPSEMEFGMDSMHPMGLDKFLAMEERRTGIRAGRF